MSAKENKKINKKARRRREPPPSRKWGCPCQIVVRDTVAFPDYKVVNFGTKICVVVFVIDSVFVIGCPLNNHLFIEQHIQLLEYHVNFP